MPKPGNNKYLWRGTGKGISHNVKDIKKLSYLNKIIEFFLSAEKPYITEQEKEMVWHARGAGLKKIQVLLEMKIAKDGSLEYITVIQSSGFRLYDQLIVDQFKRAARFPDVPKHFKKDYFKFRLGVFTPL